MVAVPHGLKSIVELIFIFFPIEVIVCVGLVFLTSIATWSAYEAFRMLSPHKSYQIKYQHTVGGPM